MVHPLSRIRLLTLIVAALALSLPAFSLAQQLRITEGARTSIEDVGTYRAYYGLLGGEPHVYSFAVDAETPVSFVVLVPDTSDAKTDISIALSANQNAETPLSRVDGGLLEWTRFFDTAGRDSYLAGPAIQATVPAGEYEVRITNPETTGRYVLVVGSDEVFSFSESLRRYATLPTIKTEFFQKSAMHAYVTPLLLWPIFGFLSVIGLALFAFIVYRRRMHPHVPHEVMHP